MITARQIYNQSIHSSTGFSPPIRTNNKPIEIDLELTLHYNEKRKQELLPFYALVYRKSVRTARRNLDKII